MWLLNRPLLAHIGLGLASGTNRVALAGTSNRSVSNGATALSVPTGPKAASTKTYGFKYALSDVI